MPINAHEMLGRAASIIEALTDKPYDRIAGKQARDWLTQYEEYINQDPPEPPVS